MPIEARLSVPEGGKAAENLQTCLALRAALQNARADGGLLLIDVKSVLLLQDVYGRVHDHAPSDLLLWQRDAARPVLFEPDLRDFEKVGYLGTWNLDFLRWLRGISIEASEVVEIYYEYERGDTLYESAWWESAPSSAEGRVEVFGIQSNDGMDEPLWRAEVIRLADGRIEVREG
ncbi:hypothetical protein [Variovorax paradoxus]|uniref:hypothetical protein n=1 Tax=Variovorax paradoxus TaxID=34073 RepID=UPI0029C7E7D1|nr:hypothetical protein RZE77_31340 [Variovorax paradoxus]